MVNLLLSSVYEITIPMFRRKFIKANMNREMTRT